MTLFQLELELFVHCFIYDSSPNKCIKFLKNVNGKIVTCASFSIYSGNVGNFIDNYTYWNYQAEAKYISIWFIANQEVVFT